MGLVVSCCLIFEGLSEFADENVEFDFTVRRGISIARSREFPILNSSIQFDQVNEIRHLLDRDRRIAILRGKRWFD
jgi:hypothetical protein